MGEFRLDWISSIVDVGMFGVAVESGTFRGDSTEILRQRFGTVHTIEIQPDLYKTATRRFVNRPNVICWPGDSSQIITNLAKIISSPTLWFLDAHWSGDRTVDWQSSNWYGYGVDTGHRGTPGRLPTSAEQVPLMEELEAIATFSPHTLIYIDDADKLTSDYKGQVNKGFLGEDWSHVRLTPWLERVKNRTMSIHAHPDGCQLAIELSAL